MDPNEKLLKIPRELATAYGRQALEIIQREGYVTPSGSWVDLAEEILFSQRHTRSYPPDQQLPDWFTGDRVTGIMVNNETTLSAALRLIRFGHDTVVLNFASATEPGGGFLRGARAQEEYLARSTTLYACLKDNPMYAFHRRQQDPIYTNYAIYSPGVAVFRADDGNLLEQPYSLSMITSPAVYAKAIPTDRVEEIRLAMWQRILKVLAIGAIHRHEAIVLGAWGCGAFGNDPWIIAELFHQALMHNFRGVYQRVIFAITDWSPEERTIGPFKHLMG